MISGYELNHSSGSKDIDPNTVWIYHERQQALLCGQHALNNLAQSGEVFTPYELAAIAQQLDAMELQFMAQSNEGGVKSPDYMKRLMEGSYHVDATGNFSIEVLKAALQHRYGISLPHLSHKDLEGKEITEFQGFLCHKSDHWFAIRQIGGRFWNLNSTLELPVVISHFKLAIEMAAWQNEGYTIFCIPSGLPDGGLKPTLGHTISSNNNWWHRMSDLLSGKSSGKDPWENLGSGMRLDGKQTTINADMDDLTEEEQLQLALQYSVEQSVTVSSLMGDDGTDSKSTTAFVPLPPEPAIGTPGAVRVQFRLPPDGRNPNVRRFLESDSVDVVYSYVHSELEYPKQAFELRYGFPPKNLSLVRNKTIGEAKLSNESVICRYL